MSCPICKLYEKEGRVRSNGERQIIECARCGKFEISGTASAMANVLPADFKLSAWIRSYEFVGSSPMISSTTLEEIGKGLPSYRVSEKQTLFLRALEERTKFAGQKIHIVPEFDFTLAWCTTEEELKYIIQALIGRGFVQLQDHDDPKESFSLELSITPQGWTFLDETAKSATTSRQAFVAMSFSPELQSAWVNGIEPAIKNAGWQPYRVDSTPHIDRIDTRIVSEIKNSRFIIADVTQQKAGVYFEAGLAIGLGLPVFWSVRADDLRNVHFDTRQYNHIVWQTEEQLADKLYFFITAIVGKGNVV